MDPSDAPLPLPAGGEGAPAAMAELGARLRRARRAVGMSLRDVADRSGGAFRASVLGRYERGERAMTVQRLDLLASIYGTTAMALLTDDPPARRRDEARSLAPEPRRGPGAQVVIDVSSLRWSSDPSAVAVLRFCDSIRRERAEPTSTFLHIRRSDLAVMAAILGVAATAIVDRLGELGALALVPTAAAG